MVKEEVYGEVKELVLKVLEIQKNQQTIDETSLINLGLDSIKTISLVILIEEHFGIELEDEDLLFENYSSIERITQMIKKYI